MPELRKDPILDRWVIIAAERGHRPLPPSGEAELPLMPNGPFTAGNEDKTPAEVFAVRPPGSPANGPVWDVRVVPNRFPALQVEGQVDPRAVGLFDAMNGVGAHEVIIETPRHDVDLSDLPPGHVEKVLTAYTERIRDLRRDLRLRYHCVFRNRGAAAGATLRHPHSQLIATPIIPALPKAKLAAAREHFRRKERCLFADLIDQERRDGSRVVLESAHHLVLAPYASRSPFELVVYPLRQCHDFTLLTDAERADLAAVLVGVLRRVRAALGDPAYNYMLFNAPSTSARPGRPDYWGTLAHDWRWHLEILPRVTGTAGFEWGTGFHINPVAPEEAAAFLRQAS
ncbi:MAG: hypothetical protein IT204_24740 [Fimbriimonadaceae bacterium]|nr:hypothetical protein [Fimbriimonadaceae bacterium]